MFSFGMQSYYELSNEGVTQLITNGKHLYVLTDCPDKVYEIMECWNMDTVCRLIFCELHEAGQLPF